MISTSHNYNSTALYLTHSTSYSTRDELNTKKATDSAQISNGSDATRSPVTRTLGEITHIAMTGGGEKIDPPSVHPVQAQSIGCSTDDNSSKF